MAGEWNVKVEVGKLPQKLASYFTDLNIVGAEYEPIAYLGHQVVHGTNHAVLCKQILTTGRDTTNVVVIILNERADSLTLRSIERVLEQGAPVGGFTIDVQTTIPEDALEDFNKAFEGRVGAHFVPQVYLGSQVVKGINRVFLVESQSIMDDSSDVDIVVANALLDRVEFIDILQDRLVMGLGATLGEWPQ